MLLVLCSPLGARAQSVTLSQAELVDEGFRVFTEETFEGNGRKCSTCHLPEAHYSIGPADIAKLSEEDRALVMATTVPDFENPTLVEQLALFNIGAVSNSECRQSGEFRSSMSIAALDLTASNQGGTFPGPFGPQLGWGGNGSPRAGCNHGLRDPAADGSIRAFSNGAIAQHHSKTQKRVVGEDFRFATDAELDALEAFQRWLGRRPTPSGTGEFELSTLTFSDERIEQGKSLFMTPQATCNVCHTNGGAHFTGVPPIPIIGGTNFNLETGVESERARLSAETGVKIPLDEGGFSTPPPNVAAELGSFNLQSIIEAPRKQAFFHNSARVGDIEDATKFYFTASFLDSPTNVVFPDRPEHCATLECLDEITPQALDKLGAFLRGLSAFYSLRDCERLLQESIDRIDLGVSISVPVKHCGFALHDVCDVLQGSHLSPPPFEAIADLACEVAEALDAATDSAADSSTSERLVQGLTLIQSMREGIATTPELGVQD